MTYRVSYSDGFARDLERLDPQVARRIVAFLADRIDGANDPRELRQALQGSRLGHLWRYRVGDWRIIADIQDSTLIILALHAGHRRDVYES